MKTVTNTRGQLQGGSSFAVSPFSLRSLSFNRHPKCQVTKLMSLAQSKQAASGINSGLGMVTKQPSHIFKHISKRK